MATPEPKLRGQNEASRLNQRFDRMVSAISLHGGTVDKFIGDAVMATFGGLIPLAHPASAALDAAVGCGQSSRS